MRKGKSNLRTRSRGGTRRRRRRRRSSSPSRGSEREARGEAHAGSAESSPRRRAPLKNLRKEAQLRYFFLRKRSGATGEAESGAPARVLSPVLRVERPRSPWPRRVALPGQIHKRSPSSRPGRWARTVRAAPLSAAGQNKTKQQQQIPEVSNLTFCLRC